MRTTSEYHMQCPCGAAIVTRELGPVKCAPSADARPW